MDTDFLTAKYAEYAKGNQVGAAPRKAVPKRALSFQGEICIVASVAARREGNTDAVKTQPGEG
ncbi:MAG: hypothetical protein QOJ40_1259 [Verrucomicrobiota bacterium]